MLYSMQKQFAFDLCRSIDTLIGNVSIYGLSCSYLVPPCQTFRFIYSLFSSLSSIFT